MGPFSLAKMSGRSTAHIPLYVYGAVYSRKNVRAEYGSYSTVVYGAVYSRKNVRPERGWHSTARLWDRLLSQKMSGPSAVQVRLQSIGQKSCYKKSSKNSAERCFYLDIVTCVKINVFRAFFTLRFEMHVGCDNQYKTETDRTGIVVQPMLFECMGICVLNPAHESEMRGSLLYQLIVKYLLISFKMSHSI